MSYFEYNDLFVKAQQEGGEYRIFTYDIENSKQMSKYDRYIAQYEIKFLIERVYADLIELERALKRDILIKEESFDNLVGGIKSSNDFNYRFEPFLFGDTIGLTIYNGSIEPCVVDKIFEMNKNEMNIKYNFHKNNIIYQTHDYGLANSLYFRGYAIHLCQELHKDINKHLNKYLDKNSINDEILSKCMDIVKSNHGNAIKNAIKVLSEYVVPIVDKEGNYLIDNISIKEEYQKRLLKTKI